MDNKGTITWFDTQNHPPLDESTKWDMGYTSAAVLVTDGKWIETNRYWFNKKKEPICWSECNSPFAPTHWAYINFPEATTA